MNPDRRRFLGCLGAAALPVEAYEFPALLRSDLAAFADRVVARHGLDEARVRELLLDARFLPAVLRSMAAPGTARPWKVFRPGYVNRQRIDGGVSFWRDSEPLLARTREVFGVPEELVVAILGVETVYGRSTGVHRVLDALVTLGFEGQNRPAYFQSELEEFLLLARDGVIDPVTARGSYAGAMGWPQFMPSSLRRLGFDLDGDGRIDLWGSPADIVGSVANYFRQHGWRPGEDVVLRANVADPKEVQDLVSLGIKPVSGRRELEVRGVVTERPLRGDEQGALLIFEADSGPEYWVGLDNFYVITRYNRSQNYALAVWQLAQAISMQWRSRST